MATAPAKNSDDKLIDFYFSQEDDSEQIKLDYQKFIETFQKKWLINIINKLHQHYTNRTLVSELFLAYKEILYTILWSIFYHLDRPIQSLAMVRAASPPSNINTNAKRREFYENNIREHISSLIVDSGFGGFNKKNNSDTTLFLGILQDLIVFIYRALVVSFKFGTLKNTPFLQEYRGREESTLYSYILGFSIFNSTFKRNILEIKATLKQIRDAERGASNIFSFMKAQTNAMRAERLAANKAAKERAAAEKAAANERAAAEAAKKARELEIAQREANAMAAKLLEENARAQQSVTAATFTDAPASIISSERSAFSSPRKPANVGRANNATESRLSFNNTIKSPAKAANNSDERIQLLAQMITDLKATHPTLSTKSIFSKVKTILGEQNNSNGFIPVSPNLGERLPKTRLSPQLSNAVRRGLNHNIAKLYQNVDKTGIVRYLQDNVNEIARVLKIDPSTIAVTESDTGIYLDIYEPGGGAGGERPKRAHLSIHTDLQPTNSDVGTIHIKNDRTGAAIKMLVERFPAYSLSVNSIIGETSKVATDLAKAISKIVFPKTRASSPVPEPLAITRKRTSRGGVLKRRRSKKH